MQCQLAWLPMQFQLAWMLAPLIFCCMVKPAASGSPTSYTQIRSYAVDNAHFNGKKPVKFGAAASIEVGASMYAKTMEVIRGYDLFLHWLNVERPGGGGVLINGSWYPTEFYLVNDASNGTLTAWGTQHMIDNYGVDLFLGGYSSGLTTKSAKVVQDNGKFMLNSGASSSSVFVNRSHIFGSFLPAKYYFDSTMKMFSEQPTPPTRVAFYQEDKGWPKSACSSIPRLSAMYNMEVVYTKTISVDAEQSELKDVFTEMAATNPDIVLGCVYEKVCLNSVVAARRNAFNPKAFLLTTCLDTASVKAEMDRSILYHIGPVTWTRYVDSVDAISGWTSEQFYQRYTDRFGTPPSYLSAGAWGGIAALIHAIESTNSVAPAVLAEFAKTMDVSTLAGPIKFDENGQARGDMLVIQHQNMQAPTVVVPSLAGSEIVYPKPTWDELKCLDTDAKEGENASLTDHGYPDAQSTQCGHCPQGKASHVEKTADGKPRRICRACPTGRSLWQVGALLAKEEKVYLCKECDYGTFWCGAGWENPEYPSYILEDFKESRACGAKHINAGISMCLNCPPGRYSDDEGSTLCKECIPGRYQNMPGNSECTSCAQFDPSKGLVKESSEDDPSNSSLVVDVQAETHGYFSAVHASIRCTACPEGALCQADANGDFSGYTNADGYFLMKSQDLLAKDGLALGKLWPCPHGKGDACLSHGRCYVTDDGDVSMDGPFCGSCKSGFGKGESLGLCGKCPSPAKAWGLAFSSQVVMFSLTSALSIASFLRDPRKIMPTRSVILRQCINYVHMTSEVMAVSSLSGAGSDVIGYLGGFQYVAGAKAPRQTAIGAECYLKNLAPDTDIYKSWVMAGLLCVPMWLTFNVFFFALVFLLCKMCRMSPPTMTHFVTWVTLNLFVIQPRITKLFLIPFDCDFTDEFRQLTQTSVMCDSTEVFVWQVLGMLGLIGFSCGIPAMLIIVLRRFKRKNQLYSQQCIRMFGFLFQGLKPEFYFFEAFNMIRKVVYQMVAEIPWLTAANRPGNDPDVQISMTSLNLLVITVIFMIINLRCRPYDSREFFIFHQIESAMLRAVLVTCLAQAWIFVTGFAWIFQDECVFKDRNVAIRDFLVTLFVLMFHFEFFWKVVKGVFGPELRKTERWRHYFGGTVLRVEKHGLVAKELGQTGQNFVAETIRGLAMRQLKKGRFDYNEFTDSMRQMCIESLYQKDRDHFTKRHPIAGYTMKQMRPGMTSGTTQDDTGAERELSPFETAAENLKNRVKRIPCTKLGRRIMNMLDSVEEVATHEHEWVSDPFFPFDAQHIEHVIGTDIGAEDLQMAVIRTGWREKGQQRTTFLKKMKTGKTGTMFFGQKAQEPSSWMDEPDDVDLRDAAASDVPDPRGGVPEAEALSLPAAIASPRVAPGLPVPPYTTSDVKLMTEPPLLHLSRINGVEAAEFCINDDDDSEEFV